MLEAAVPTPDVLHIGRETTLEHLVVDAAGRGKRVGEFLIKEFKMRAKAEGCSVAALYAQERTANFYEKQGFQRSGVELRCRL